MGSEMCIRDRSKNWPLNFPKNVATNELAGVIVNNRGEPLAGAVVDFFPAFKGHETKTDEQGVFRYGLKNVGPTTEVRFSCDGYSPVYRRKQRLGEQEFRVVLNKKTYLEGEVTDSNGKPVPNANVIAAHPYTWVAQHPSYDRETRTKTDEKGHYLIHLCPETYVLSVTSPDHGVARLHHIEVEKNQGRTQDVQLGTGVDFRVKVLDAQTKKPISGLCLYHRTNAAMRGISDAEGFIEIENLLPGAQEFQVGSGKPEMTKGGYFECKTRRFGTWWSPQATKSWHRVETAEVGIMFEVTEGMETLELFVNNGVLVTGKVVDPQGKPVAGATVAPASLDAGLGLGGNSYSVKTKQDGTYAIHLPASDSEFNLVAHDGSYGEWRNYANNVSEPMTTKPGERINDLDIQLQNPAIVRGQVTAEAGGNVKGLEVRAHASDQLGNYYYAPSTRTKEDGTFEIGFVRPGKHYIQVEPNWKNPEDGPEGSWVIVEVNTGETTAGIELQASADASP